MKDLMKNFKMHSICLFMGGSIDIDSTSNKPVLHIPKYDISITGVNAICEYMNLFNSLMNHNPFDATLLISHELLMLNIESGVPLNFAKADMAASKINAIKEFAFCNGKLTCIKGVLSLHFDQLGFGIIGSSRINNFANLINRHYSEDLEKVVCLGASYIVNYGAIAEPEVSIGEWGATYKVQNKLDVLKVKYRKALTHIEVLECDMATTERIVDDLRIEKANSPCNWGTVNVTGGTITPEIFTAMTVELETVRRINLNNLRLNKDLINAHIKIQELLTKQK